MRILILSLLVTLAQCGPLKEEPPNFRLSPTDFKPLKYQIHLTLNDDFIETKEFTGIATIDIEKGKKAPNLLRLHADPNMKEMKVLVDGKDVKSEDVVPADSATQIMTIEGESIKKAKTKFNVTFQYTGKLYEDMFGFYLSKVDDNETIATTQFESAYARRAFPCFDEPSFKAKFQMTFTVPQGYNVVTNQVRDATYTARESPTFEETPPMSTYLVAFVVSKYVPTTVEFGTSIMPMQIWTAAATKNHTEYAASVSRKIIDNLSSLLSPKNEAESIRFEDMGIGHLDQIAIPDFASGAMENWGLVTYRENALLWDAIESKKHDQQRIAAIITHEFAHNWFGNLVTTAWWNNTWLNEGFARYFEYHGLLGIPGMEEFEMDKQFIHAIQETLEADGHGSGLALQSEANTVSEIQNKFDAISYGKGGSIVRMMEKIVGKETFFKNLYKYLNANKYKNVVPADLFKQFEKINENVTFADVMKNWIETPGYPVVKVDLVNGKVVINQTPFTYSKVEKPKEANVAKWYIPVTSKVLQISEKAGKADTPNTTTVAWLDTEVQSLEINAKLEDQQAIIVNDETSGYYRVNYDQPLWDRLIKLLKLSSFGQVSDITRAQLVDDAMNLARTGDMNYKQMMTLLEYLKEEKSFYPWTSALKGLSYLRKRLVGNPLRDQITSTMKELLGKFYEENKEFKIKESAKAIEIYTRTLALQWACELDVPQCVSDAKKQFEVILPIEGNKTRTAAAEPLDANLRSIIYCSGLRHSADAGNSTEMGEDEKNWNQLWEMYQKTNVASEKLTLITALGCTKNPVLLKKYLEKSIEPNSPIREQDGSSVFTAVLTGNPVGVNVSLAFLDKDFDTIYKKYSSLGAIAHIINQVADRVSSPVQKKQFENFIQKNKGAYPDLQVVGEEALKAVSSNVQWTEDYKDKLNDYFEKPSGGGNGAGNLIASSISILLCIFVFRL